MARSENKTTEYQEPDRGLLLYSAVLFSLRGPLRGPRRRCLAQSHPTQPAEKYDDLVRAFLCGSAPLRWSTKHAAFTTW
jgi:hypothetical protein